MPPPFRMLSILVPALLGATLVLVAPASAQFSPPQGVNLGIGISPASISGVLTADLDNDGLRDIVATDDANTGNIGLALGLSGGGYSVQAVVTDPNGSPAGAFLPCVADFDLDGSLDLVYAGTTPAAGATHTAVFVKRGVAGAGTYTFVNPLGPPLIFSIEPLPSEITGLATTDFNRDGQQDILLTVRGSTGGSRRVQIITGTGGFTFGPLHSTTTATGAAEIDVCVDFNRDGFKDLVICRPEVIGGPNGEVDIYAGTGLLPPLPSTPTVSLPFPPGLSPVDVHWVECDQVNGYDLAVSCEGAIPGIVMLRNLGAPPWFLPVGPTAVFPVTNVPQSLLRLETDFDGLEDLAVFSVAPGTTGVKPADLEILRVKDCQLASASVTSTGSFNANAFAVPVVTDLLAVGDQRSDGKTDVVVVDHGAATANDVVQVYTNIKAADFAISPNRPLLAQIAPVTFHIEVPAALALRPFLILFSRMGTLPGVPIGGMILPLNPPFEQFQVLGILNAAGVGTFTTPPVAFPATPTTFSLQLAAAVLVQGAAPATVGYVSNPAVITLP